MRSCSRIKLNRKKMPRNDDAFFFLRFSFFFIFYYDFCFVFIFLFTASSFNLFAALWKLKSECVNSAGRSWTQLATISLARPSKLCAVLAIIIIIVQAAITMTAATTTAGQEMIWQFPCSKPFALQIPQMYRRKDSAVSFQLNSFVRFPFAFSFSVPASFCLC